MPRASQQLTAPVLFGRREIEVVDRAAAWMAKHPDEPWREHPARCFVLVERGRGDHLVHRAYERSLFLRLAARVKRGGGALGRAEVAKILGLTTRTAALVDEGVTPGGEAVVMARGEVVGAWAPAGGREPRSRVSRAPTPEFRIDRITPSPALDDDFTFGAFEEVTFTPFSRQPFGKAPRGVSIKMRKPSKERVRKRSAAKARAKKRPSAAAKARAKKRSAAEARPKKRSAAKAPRKAAAAEETIRRTPHIGLPGKPIEPGQRFTVKVFTDTSGQPLEGEASEDVVIAAPAGQDSFATVVWLVPSDHFVVRSKDTGELTIERDVAESAPLEFEVEARKSLKGVEGRPALTANFLYGSRSVGQVRREVKLAGGPSAQRSGGGGGLELQPLAQPPDVFVAISRAGTGQSYHCLVEAPGVPGFEQPVTEEWGIRDGGEAAVADSMQSFSAKGISVRRRRARLCGAGRSLFGKAPRNFQEVVKGLDRAGAEGRTIFIATEDAAMPWELLISPTAGDGSDTPLGVRHVVARWTHPELRCSFPPFKLQRSGIVAPKYEGERELKWSGEEATFVRTRLKGKRLKPVTFDSLDDKLGESAPSLLHFICHGAAGEGTAETIWLDQDESLTSEELLGMPGVRKACEAAHPIVFMNACEVGRSVPALVGANGFAQSFVELGARAVIAPLWRVKDQLAHEIAIEFYKAALADRQRPFADILREIRAKTYAGRDAEDTYAAYCFFGDPALRLKAKRA